jgi:hypothetical protein
VEVQWPGGAVTRLHDIGPGWIVLDEERGVVAARQE